MKSVDHPVKVLKFRPVKMHAELAKSLNFWSIRLMKKKLIYTEQNYKRPMWHFETFISLRGCKIY